eukprot:CAMPEP_0195587984 /NCGR_PEP_ID=MMETSP0814-20130614/31894_1 /TAXON_ID=97485 /ORGANISM="Prymnesium parvum, Strain Texoma1" /LENGTH=109 /DNA_ID=CAMNT_0040726867 /DNA_START=579 /DNA_END=908 /DNA_ORIENTATION=-
MSCSLPVEHLRVLAEVHAWLHVVRAEAGSPRKVRVHHVQAAHGHVVNHEPFPRVAPPMIGRDLATRRVRRARDLGKLLGREVAQLSNELAERGPVPREVDGAPTTRLAE